MSHDNASNLIPVVASHPVTFATWEAWTKKNEAEDNLDRGGSRNRDPAMDTKDTVGTAAGA